ncbi:MarR family winged helix-turn-helix transcriptional regulator [Nocardia goodfellowii]
MSTAGAEPDSAGPDADDAVRAMLLLMPRLVGRAKKSPPPEELRSLALAPRHLSLLSYLLFDGPMTVNELAARLEVAPTTVSLMVSDLSRQGVLERQTDAADRRRKIINIAEAKLPAIRRWLARGADAWHTALEPLNPAQRRLFIETLRAYENAVSADDAGPSAR